MITHDDGTALEFAHSTKRLMLLTCAHPCQPNDADRCFHRCFMESITGRIHNAS